MLRFDEQEVIAELDRLGDNFYQEFERKAFPEKYNSSAQQKEEKMIFDAEIELAAVDKAFEELRAEGAFDRVERMVYPERFDSSG